MGEADFVRKDAEKTSNSQNSASMRRIRESGIASKEILSDPNGPDSKSCLCIPEERNPPKQKKRKEQKG